MARIAAGRVGRRRFRRPAFLLAVGIAVSLGIAAVAGAAILAKAPRDQPSGSPSLRIAPPARTLAPGGSTTYAVHVQSGQGRASALSGRIELSVGAGAPAGARISFSPRSIVVPQGTSGRISKLTIHTGAATPAGTYRFQIRARRPHGQVHETATLIVSAPSVTPSPPSSPTTTPAPPVTAPAPVEPEPGPVLVAPDAFTISGKLAGLLEPGSDAPLDLSLASLEHFDLSITGLTVRVAAVSAPRSDALHPCGPADFSVAQFSGAAGFTLAASTTATLAELGFDEAQWPRVAMVDSAVNQNGCRSASLQLGFAGTATEASP